MTPFDFSRAHFRARSLVSRLYGRFAPLLRSLNGSPDYLEQQVERSWQKEWRTLLDLGLRDGADIVDIGCGPGHFTRKLADQLPSARIVALDADSASIAHAGTTFSNGGRDCLSFALGRAEHTGLPAESADFVLARLVFQHLRNPADAVREAYRVLRQGGKLIVTDIDDGLFGMTQPELPELARVLDAYGRAQSERGGNRRIARSLVPLLREGQFCDVRLDTITMTSDDPGISNRLPQFDPAPLGFLVRSNLISRREYSEVRAAHDKFVRTPGSFAVVLSFMASGTKPCDEKRG